MHDIEMKENYLLSDEYIQTITEDLDPETANIIIEGIEKRKVEYLKNSLLRIP